MEDHSEKVGPKGQMGEGGVIRVPCAVGETAGSGGEGRGDVARGIQRDRRRGQEAEGTCGAGPAQRPRSAALRGWPSNPALRRQTGRKRAQRETIGGPRGNGRSPIFSLRVYGAREASPGSALPSDPYAAQRTRP